VELLSLFGAERRRRSESAAAAGGGEKKMATLRYTFLGARATSRGNQ